MRGRRGGEERREDGDEREREREENFMQIDKDLLTHYLYVSLQDRERRGDEKKTKRRGEERGW